jgi:hypothetical protein
MPTTWPAASVFLTGFLLQLAIAPTWMARTQGEQALVRLAPALPVAPACFNRLLAKGLLLRGLVNWSMVSGAVLLLALVSGVRGEALWWHACLCCMVLPALAMSLRDHARRTASSVLLVLLLFIALGCVGPLAGAIGVGLLGLPFWPVATLAALALTVVLVQHRWRAMCAAPIAFPAGRLD